MRMINRLPISVVRGLLLGWLAAVPTVLAVQEENLAEPRPRHFSIGITAGIDRNYHSVDMVYMSDMKFDKFRTGSVYGFRIGYAPLKWLSINTGAVLIQKNYHMDHVFEYYNLRYSLNTTMTNDYVNVPLELKLSVGRVVQIHAFGGVFGGYWLRGHRKGNTYSFSNERYFDVDEDWEFNDKRDNRIEKGFTWGAGLSGKIIDRIEVGAEIRWYYSITDIQKPYMQNLNPRYNTAFAIQGGLSYWL